MSILLTDADYKEKMPGLSGLVMVHKPLCPNCKAMEKVLEKFTAAYPQVSLIQVDSIASPELAGLLGAERVPALCVLKNGTVAARKIGIMNVKDLAAFYFSA